MSGLTKTQIKEQGHPLNVKDREYECIGALSALLKIVLVEGTLQEHTKEHIKEKLKKYGL